MLKKNDLKIGTRVRCLWECHYDKNGTITSVSGYDSSFIVKFDDPNTPPCSWSLLSSFELLSHAPSIKEKPCHHCGKVNNLGVSVCWCCATLDP